MPSEGQHYVGFEDGTRIWFSDFGEAVRFRRSWELETVGSDYNRGVAN